MGGRETSALIGGLRGVVVCGRGVVVCGRGVSLSGLVSAVRFLPVQIAGDDGDVT